MGVFIDTSGFVAVRNENDINFNPAMKVMHSLLKGEYGSIYTSDYVFDEATTLALVRTQKKRLSIDIGNYILKSKKIALIFTTIDDFFIAWNLFLKYKDKQLSFTDCTILSIMNRLGIDYIFSFDSHFDGLKTRLF
ncbi:MAG: type II toxin-antitoxin system VapC family toxin [Candidatus Helarchaeota archaeon]